MNLSQTRGGLWLRLIQFNEIKRLADQFWLDAGGEEPFPRNLERAIAWALPLAIVKVPRLCTKEVQKWLTSRRVPIKVSGWQRRLRGCLIAYGGKGIAFLDGCDPPNEMCLSLAHETAHFICDYHLPRKRAIEKLGDKIVEVLDGHRRPTFEEKINSILTGVRVGFHIHMMERDPVGRPLHVRTCESEDKADLLALELIAPADAVQRAIKAKITRRPYPEQRTTVAKALVTEFALPSWVANSYAEHMMGKWRKARTVYEWLGI